MLFLSHLQIYFKMFSSVCVYVCACACVHVCVCPDWVGTYCIVEVFQSLMFVLLALHPEAVAIVVFFFK